MDSVKKVLFVMSLVFLISVNLAFETTEEVEEDNYTSIRSRILAEANPRAPATCDIFPRICRGKGSQTPDCCRKQCVNVMTDNLNCGQCGRRCRYGEGCCKGQCVSLMYDRNHCGGCNSKCKKGSYCRYGMCSYA
ncbi:hypothetical protein QJS10_CPA01g01764 [Acorus calamus]|uniref:Stigma-specific STIG1-like protein 1 n=1 Tax=Acorus calamus TaxID=4465 RepID=A0AAV9FHC6_ACOCL|nr:hypothetical protein QJS10_CPA01g01764 [Acorus calamus]